MTRFFFALFLLACGASAPPADEVTETWTEGDDEPLEPAPE
jgi:hypothetical protein